ncbi:DUF1285 domain-containing protein [Rhizobium paknamense]|uniref:DUF1285 domain-containing protein n=1 Tax=Rhizobium paknamense TaxID=1206817 RepID=A0ABU0I8C4_9HYPH|nr:DUF1285 domain-containing protein [Rhizobium paknamense]MDQ0454483.1 hypothetical protein [Rhizobium paknamense]
MAGEEDKQAGETGDLAALIARAAEQRAGGKDGLPPVDRWNPPFCGDIDMEIKRDGSWIYNGSPIGRAPLVRLFSTVLRRDEDGETYLVTPVEKLRIRVEDAHFLAVEMTVSEREGEPVLTFRTNVGDVVEAGPEHGLHFAISDDDQAVKPYLRVRGRLTALVSRAVTYELMEQGESMVVDGVEMFVIRSAGAVFPVMAVQELERLSQ